MSINSAPSPMSSSGGASASSGGGPSAATSGPVARWLDTIVSSNMCKQYVEVFKRYGYDTLSDVCKLEAHQLAKMGVTHFDNEKIMEEVSVLRQTLKGRKKMHFLLYALSLFCC